MVLVTEDKPEILTKRSNEKILIWKQNQEFIYKYIKTIILYNTQYILIFYIILFLLIIIKFIINFIKIIN